MQVKPEIEDVTEYFITNLSNSMKRSPQDCPPSVDLRKRSKFARQFSPERQSKRKRCEKQLILSIAYEGFSIKADHSANRFGCDFCAAGGLLTIYSRPLFFAQFFRIIKSLTKRHISFLALTSLLLLTIRVWKSAKIGLP